ncbi:MAG TPA: MFS transporter [Acidimicrobiales bacterium]|nr:MFS transporter [Acidimicrobiales bacterium]
MTDLERFPHEQDAERAAAAVVRDEPGSAGLWAMVRDLRGWASIARSPYGLRPLVLLIWTAFFVDFNGTVLGIAFQRVLRDTGLKYASYLRYVQTSQFVLIFVLVGVAYLLDRRRRIPIVAAGVLLSGICTGLTAPAHSPLTFGLPDMWASVFINAALLPVGSLLADYYGPEVRGRVFAVWGLMGALPGIVVPKVVGALVEAHGWRVVYAVSSVPVVLVGILIVLLLRDPIRGYVDRLALGLGEETARIAEEPPSLGEAWRMVFGIRTIRRLFVANAIASAATVTLPALQTGFLVERHGLTPNGLANVAALTAAIVLPGYFVAGPLVDWFMQRRPSQVLTLFGLVTLVSTLTTLAFAFNAPLALLVATVALTSLARSALRSTIAVLYAQVTPAHVRTLGIAMRDLAYGFAPIGGLFIPAIGLSWGYRGMFLFCFALLFVSALVQISSAPLFELDMRSALAANAASEEYRRAKAEGAGKLLVCRDVDVAYSGVQVLFGVDFDVEEGEIIALLGTNGAGKSTLLRAIAGLTPASSGAIVFDGRDITFMPPNETAERGIVFMPGGRGIFPGLSVRENLLLGTWMHEDGTETRHRLEEVFSIFPRLAERADALAGSLSGGEQQQLSLAQAFLCSPRLLMIDELSLGLSPAVVGELIEIVKRIHSTGVTVIVVEQSVNVALTLAEKAIFMEKGEVKFFGRTKDLMARPDILRAVYVKGTGGAATTTMTPQRRRELDAARPILELEGLTKRFGGITAVDDVSFSVPEGEVLGLIGPNGSGKTTLFDLVSGYQVPDAGVIRFDGVDITTLPPDERARRKLMRRFQDARLFPALTVFETILVALEQQLEVRGSFAGALSLPQSRRAERRVRARAEALIELLDLGSYRDKFVRELSTGLRRIVDLACVLAGEPRLLLLDEPSSGIAQAEAEGLGSLLTRVRFETGCTILVIEHDMPLISSVADELLALDRGAVVTRGTPATVLDDERVIEAYLGGSEAAIRRSGSLR